MCQRAKGGRKTPKGLNITAQGNTLGNIQTSIPPPPRDPRGGREMWG